MLVKKELENIKPHKFLKSYANKGNYFLNGDIYELEKSGKVLVVDIFKISTKKLLVRFFCDKNNFLTYIPSENKWTKRRLSNATRDFNEEGKYLNDYTNHYYYLDKTIDKKGLINKVQNFIKIESYSSRVIDLIDRFVENQNFEKASKRKEKLELQKEQHLELFQSYPNDIEEYCNKNIFDNSYVFISKQSKNGRDAYCTSCGQKFIADNKTKHKGIEKCPCCKKEVTYYLSVYQGSIKENANLCITDKVDGKLILRWLDVSREFINNIPRLYFCDYFRSLLTSENGKTYRYNYKYGRGMYWDYEYKWRKVEYENYTEVYLYTRNLINVFEDKGLAKDIIFISNKLGKLNIQKLFSKKLIETIKNLVELGINNLAREICESQINSGKTFLQVIGISKQYLPLIRKYDISMNEIQLLKKSDKFIKDEDFCKYRNLIKTIDRYKKHEIIDNILKLLKKFSFRKIINYYYKQLYYYPEQNIYDLYQLHNDYIQMLKDLDISIEKNIAFPKNIKESHDVLILKINEMLGNVEEHKDIDDDQKILYTNKKEFSDSKYTIVYPETRKDLIIEGQVLSHCVGMQKYYENIIEGKKMIYFIRKTENISEPYVTFELDKKELKILQIYGKGNKKPINEVISFAEKYVKSIKKDLKEKFINKNNCIICG